MKASREAALIVSVADSGIILDSDSAERDHVLNAKITQHRSCAFRHDKFYDCDVPASKFIKYILSIDHQIVYKADSLKTSHVYQILQGGCRLSEFLAVQCSCSRGRSSFWRPFEPVRHARNARVLGEDRLSRMLSIEIP